MDTRKLGLLLLAYLRGLLRSGYKHGLRSALRENLVLAALEREVVADFNARNLLAQASFSTHFSSKSVKNTMRGICSALDRLRDLVLFQNVDRLPKETGGLGSVDSLVELHHALTAVGILEKPNTDGNNP